MLRVFVDAHPVDVAPGSVARDAVAARDLAVLARLDDGTAYLTDARGIARSRCRWAQAHSCVGARRGANPMPTRELIQRLPAELRAPRRSCGPPR
jgi:hypothetical protein